MHPAASLNQAMDRLKDIINESIICEWSLEDVAIATKDYLDWLMHEGDLDAYRCVQLTDSMLFFSIEKDGYRLNQRFYLPHLTKDTSYIDSCADFDRAMQGI